MSKTIVDRLYEDFSNMLAFLEAKGEVSWSNVANENFRKVLLIAAASHFEQSMTAIVLNFVRQVTTENHPLTWLVQNKAVRRQYHTWFDWEARNANKFFGLFGTDFQDRMKEEVANDNDLNAAIQAFMEIGRERNRLVHENFGNFSLEKTSEEIHIRYIEGIRFVEWFPEALKTFAEEEAVG